MHSFYQCAGYEYHCARYYRAAVAPRRKIHLRTIQETQVLLSRLSSTTISRRTAIANLIVIIVTTTTTYYSRTKLHYGKCFILLDSQQRHPQLNPALTTCHLIVSPLVFRQYGRFEWYISSIFRKPNHNHPARQHDHRRYRRISGEYHTHNEIIRKPAL